MLTFINNIEPLCHKENEEKLRQLSDKIKDMDA